MEVNWNAVGAIFTAAATLVALAFGIRDGIRRRLDQKRRGEVALAMAYPEIARVRRGLIGMLMIITALRRGERTTSTGTVMELAAAAEFTRSWLESAGVDLYLDMPPQFRINLPTVVRGLDYVRTAPRALEQACSQGLEPIHRVLEDFEGLLRGCIIDFHAAVEYCDKHINPTQHANVKGVSVPEYME